MDKKEFDENDDFFLSEIPDEDLDFGKDDFTFLDEIDLGEPNDDDFVNEEVDKFDFLVQGKLSEDGSDNLQVREMISNRRIEIETELDLDIEEEVKRLEEIKEEEELDLSSPIPNIPTEELDEYILISGMFSHAFKDHMKSDTMVPKGDYPLAINFEGNAVLMKMIHPEPKTLYYLKHILKGFDIKIVRNGEEKDLDIYEFLGKTKIES